jgi:ketosteroid isomerase-like protein
MSEENIDVVHRMTDAGNRGDLKAWAACLHEEIVYVPLPENPQTQPLHGVDAVIDFVTDWLEPWEDYKVDVTRTVDEGDRVFVATKHSGRHETGAEISMEMYIAGVFRDGKAIELRWFMNESEALEAAGLKAPPSPSPDRR